MSHEDSCKRCTPDDPEESGRSSPALVSQSLETRDGVQHIVCTLTSPADACARKAHATAGGSAPLAQTWDGRRAALTDEQTSAACAVLLDKTLLKFDMRETRYCDRAIQGQSLSLFSFLPSAGATPDENGVYGFAKIRGTFATEDDSSRHEEALIRDSDSYHSILTVRTGQPFPVVVDGSKLSAESRNVEAEAGKALDSARKERDRVQRQEVEEVRAREAALLERNRRVEAGGEEDPEDPEDGYTTSRMKRAQLVFAFTEAKRKTEEIRALALRSFADVKRLDETSPDLRGVYMQRIRDAREKSGMSCDFSEESFMRYLGDEVDVDSLLSS